MRSHVDHRDERAKFHAPDRRQARQDLYLKLSRFMLEENRSVMLEDRKCVIMLMNHKITELIKKEEVKI